MKPHCTIPIPSSRSHSIPGSRHGCPIKRPLALHVPPGNSSANNDHSSSSSSSSLSAPSSPPSIAIGAEFENLTSRLADSNNPDFTTMRSPSTTVGCPIQNRKSNTSFSSSVAEIRVRVASRSSAKYLDFQKLLFLVLLLLLSLLRIHYAKGIVVVVIAVCAQKWIDCCPGSCGCRSNVGHGCQGRQIMPLGVLRGHFHFHFQSEFFFLCLHCREEYPKIGMKVQQ
mmetsp:Transcript_3937/g.6478  ORF Transcript_3937/g.6478 Transcript_3937/m.6478 type:complete len:226 (+) Transcript_3937:392-1069(+)